MPSSPVEQDSAGVQAAMAEFIRAFTHLDWDGFRQTWDDDATLFRPEGGVERTHGADAITERFRQEFEARRTSRPAPPYWELDPKDLHIRVVDDAAVVTFTLPRPAHTSQRTFILSRQSGVWKIAHLHASDRK